MFDELKKKLGMKGEAPKAPGQPSQEGLDDLQSGIDQESLLAKLELKPEQAATPEEAARQQGVIDDSMNNAMGMMGGIVKTAKPEQVVAQIQRKLANGERLSAAEQFAMQKMRGSMAYKHPEFSNTAAVVDPIKPVSAESQRMQSIINRWKTGK